MALEYRLKYLAKRYYGTENLSQLQAYQIDKLISWTTNINPNTGSSKDKRKGKILGRFYKKANYKQP